jgi:hypothetical protein
MHSACGSYCTRSCCIDVYISGDDVEDPEEDNASSEEEEEEEDEQNQGRDASDESAESDEDIIASSSSDDDDEGGDDGGEGGDEGGDDGDEGGEGGVDGPGSHGDQPAKGFLQGGKAESFSRAFHRLVDNVDGATRAPILAGSKSILRRKEEEKLESDASKAAKLLREEMKKRGHYLPSKKGGDPHRDALEKRLQKTATKGVVQLFNAINTAQKRVRNEEATGNKAKVAKLGKAGFLAGIRQVRERQNQEEALKVEGRDADTTKWDVLKEGFAGITENSVRLRDWEGGGGGGGGGSGGGSGSGEMEDDMWSDDGF